MKIFAVLLLTFCTSFGSAQNDSLFSLKITDLKALFNNAKYTPIQFNDTNLVVLRTISESKKNDSEIYRSTYLEKQRELKNSDYGVNLTGSYTENFNPDVADINDNLVYTRKFQAGINWSILNNGLLDNKIQVKLLDDRIERQKLKNESTNQSAYYLARFDQTIFIFNKIKVNLLNERETSLLKQYDLISELVLLKRLPKEDLIRIETRLAEVQSLKKVYNSYNNYLNYENDTLEFDHQNLPLIDLNYDNIFSTIENQTSDVMMNNEYQQYYKWYHQISLKANVKYNYYDLISTSNRDFFSAGLSVNIPIPFNTKLTNEIAHEKWKYDNEQLYANRNNVHEDVLNVAYEFRYKLKQFIGFYQKRTLLQEKLRIEEVKIKLGDNNIDPMGSLDLIDDLVSVDIELIDLLQNLYLKAIKIHSKVAFAKMDNIVVQESIQSVNKYADNKGTGVYVWSKVFKENDEGFLAEYCIYNNFNKVIVSASPKDSLLGVKLKFGQYLKGRSDYYLMLGSNKLFYHDSIEQYVDEVYQDYKSLEPMGIHLDIEPHTFDDWGTNRMELLNKYNLLVGKVRTYCEANNLKLEISIPLYYNIEIIDKLFKNVDKIYFMAYENVKNEYIAKKINPFVDVYLDKIEIAIRTEDFENRIEMKKKTESLKEITNVNSFAYHALGRLIAQDKENLKK
jgi:hypothetical protein